jgi:hypothetical protein
VAGAWRERWWTLDLLMVHGVEDLSDTERAQDEFFHLFEALKRRGSRVMLVADRPPVRIGHIDDRLRSRFEGGLVLESPARELPEGAGHIELVPEESLDGRVWHGLTLSDPAEDDVGEEGRETAPEALAPSPAPSIAPVPTVTEVPTDRASEEAGEATSEGSGEMSGASSGERSDDISARTPSTPSAAPADEPWQPDPEAVVLVWPQFEERLVEEID